MKKQVSSAALFLLPLVAIAQSPQLVEDSWQGVKNSSPGSLTVYNNKLYYAAGDSLHGRELWVYDILSSPKPQLAVDITPGTQSGMRSYPTEPMAVYNGKLYCGVLIQKLMQYSGSGTPSYLTYATVNSHAAKSFAQLGGKLYFEAASDTDDGALYSYDGTGTPVKLTSMSSEAKTSNTFPVLMPFQGKIYFTGSATPPGPSELYSYDPATGMSSLVQKINASASQGSKPQMFVTGGSRLYFAATDSATGQQLYSYDGTTVKRLTGPAISLRFKGAYGNMALYKGAIYFEATIAPGHYALYKWDTATQAASMVYDFNADGNTSFFYVAGGNLYFKAYTTASGFELWRHNGSTCAMVADLNPGTGSGMGSALIQSNFAVYRGSLYFGGNNGSSGYELYRLPDESITGIHNVSWNGEVTLYPNPASISTTLTIALQTPQSLRISLTDLSGKEVFATGLQSFAAGKSNIELSMQAFATGQYFYRVSGSSGELLASGAIVKQ